MYHESASCWREQDVLTFDDPLRVFLAGFLESDLNDESIAVCIG